MESIDLLRKIVAIPSTFPNEEGLGCFLEERLKELGFKTSRIPISDGRFNVVGEQGNSGKPILFYGHMDTVPLYGKWDSDPYELTRDGDILYGLGTFDMKAGIASILQACEVKNNRRIKVAFGVDEENDSEGSTAIVNSGFVSDVEIGICTEIASNDNNCLGPQAITLGRRGRCMLEIEVPGRSAHGAYMGMGINAITEASKLAIELENMNVCFKEHDLLPRATQQVRTFTAGSGSLSVPEKAVLEVDRHMVTPETVESVVISTQKYIDEMYQKGMFKEIDGKRIVVRAKPRKVPYLMPYVTSKDNEYARKISDIVRRRVGEPRDNYGMSVADENVFANAGVPMISIGPKGGNEHMANEWISESGYLKLIEILKEFIISA
ncbi:M20/M25/M40 family metallo-hydrolase [Candidatus Micrarchaeota archaeon]|nr:M20/M25/M40 family metallo-hydrolase [Candidatus Micrarchaeota archaeon]